MQIGDLVMRRVFNIPDWKRESAIEQQERLGFGIVLSCLLYTSPSPRDGLLSRMPSSA